MFVTPEIRTGLSEWLVPVVIAQHEFLEDRPLMNRVDKTGGLGRLLGLMQIEQEELNSEMVEARVDTSSSLNGNGKNIAVEASDVLVFAGAFLLNWKQDKTPEQEEAYFGMLAKVRELDNKFSMQLAWTAVGVITNKNSFNYPPWVFQEMPGETDDEAMQRAEESVAGLKVLRKKHPEGILLPEYWNQVGFDQSKIVDPVYVHRFLLAISKIGEYINHPNGAALKMVKEGEWTLVIGGIPLEQDHRNSH